MNRSALVAIGMGFACGCIVFVVAMPWMKRAALHGVSSPFSTSKSGTASSGKAEQGGKARGGVALRARKIPAPPGSSDGLTAPSAAGGSSDLTSPLPANTDAAQSFYVTGKALGEAFAEFEQAYFMVPRKGMADTGVRVPLAGDPLVVTRGQFLDVVSRRPPSSLPTGTTRQGALFTALTEADINGPKLRAALDDQEIAHDSLCTPRRLDATSFRRVSIVFHATQANLACVKSFLAEEIAAKRAPAAPTTRSNTDELQQEITLVALSSGDGYFASREESGHTLSLQTWDGTWLERVTTGDDNETGLSAPQRRAVRLASVARVLTKSSDVVVDMPLVPLAGPVAFGNFVVVPRAVASQGDLRVRRIGANLRKSRGKEAQTALSTLAPDTQALIVSGVGGTFRIESVPK